MKPTPLSPNPKLINRIEYPLEWLISKAIIDIPGQPIISRILTGLLLSMPIIGVASLFNLILGALSEPFQAE
jgi:hypothetical protein